MAIHDDWQSFKQSWGKASRPTKVFILLSMFTSFGAIADLSRTIANYKSFINQGIQFYSDVLVAPITSIFRVLSIPLNTSEANVLIIVGLLTASSFRANPVQTKVLSILGLILIALFAGIIYLSAVLGVLSLYASLFSFLMLGIVVSWERRFSKKTILSFKIRDVQDKDSRIWRRLRKQSVSARLLSLVSGYFWILIFLAPIATFIFSESDRKQFAAYYTMVIVMLTFVALANITNYIRAIILRIWVTPRGDPEMLRQAYLFFFPLASAVLGVCLLAAFLQESTH